LTLGVLIVSVFWVVQPFLVAATWALMIAVATWPLLIQVQGLSRGRRSPAVAVMTLALLLVLLLPFYFGISAVVEHTDEITSRAALIREMAAHNPRWGAERVRGELLKLGIRVCK